VVRELKRCQVGRHVKNGSYVILRFAGVFGIGPVIKVSKEDMERHGLPLITQILRDSPPHEDHMRYPGVPLEELLRIKRLHTIVLVYVSGSRKMEIEPLHFGHGWRYQIWPEETKKLFLPVSSKHFMKVLTDALDTAS
jgi:hypothetical protein